ncbi:MAG TPA: hypothetical protein DCZ03_13910 [Gammaproteobacteria bacterium]|nr:hypothetical protein [Gammaproteobacteria bacterium]
MELSCPHCDKEFAFDMQQVDKDSNDIPCPHCNLPIPYTELPEDVIEVSAPKVPKQGFSAFEDEAPRDPIDQLANFDLSSETGAVTQEVRAVPSNETNTFKWSLGVILLSLILVLQLLWFIRADLREVEQFRPWINLACEQFNCRLPPLADVTLIHILSSDIRTHETEEAALELNLVIESKTDFNQPFPVIELNLTGPRGELIASRRFQPEEYIYEKGFSRMPSNKPVHISLTIREPKQRVAGYSFRFYENLILDN